MSKPINRIPITPKELDEVAGAYTRWVELRAQQIQTPTTDAEIKGLSEFLADKLLTHASEFIGSLYVLKREYEPLLGLLAQLSRRVIAQVTQPPAVAATPAPEASNVTPLVQP